MSECENECSIFTAQINVNMVGVVDKDNRIVGIEPQNPTDMKVLKKLFCKKCGKPAQENNV